MKNAGFSARVGTFHAPMLAQDEQLDSIAHSETRMTVNRRCSTQVDAPPRSGDPAHDSTGHTYSGFALTAPYMSIQASAMMGREGLRCGCTSSLRIPMSQPSACGSLQPDRVSRHKWNTLETTSAMHQPGRRQNPNSRDHRRRCDRNRAVRTGGTTEFLPMPIPQA